MHSAIHKKAIITLITAVLVAPLLAVGSVFAEEVDTSVTYSAPLLPGVADYSVDTGNDVTLDVNVAEINALEITLSTSNLVIDLTPHIGVPSFDTDTLDILVGTTNTTGYTLTMASSYGGNSTTSLTRTESINNTVPTIDTIANITTPTNFASSSDTNSINKWGFMLSTTSLDVDKTVYNPVLTNNTINSSTEAVYNDPTSITFGAKVDSEQPYGNYQATLKFMAVSNVNTYSITYNAGTAVGDATLANMPSSNPDIGGLVGGGTTIVTLSSISPTRTGYNFLGWCSIKPTTTNNNDSCSGKGANVYTAGGNLTINNTDPEFELYAMWGIGNYNLTVTFVNGATSVEFVNDIYGTVTATISNPTISLYYNQPYTATMGFESDHEFVSWEGSTNVTVSDVTINPTTITLNSDAAGILTANGKESYSFTLNFGAGITGAIINSGTVAGTTVARTTTSGTKIPSAANETYYIIPLYSHGYTFNTITASGGTAAAGTYGYYYYNTIDGANVATISAKTLAASTSTSIQNLAAANCTANPSVAKDTRDNEVYYIQRLADGNCWMLDNLRLGGSSTMSLTTSNTNSNGSIALPASGSSGSYTAPAINISYKNTTDSYGQKYGVSYNYCAATARTICNYSYSGGEANAGYDVCPAGWRMAKSDSTSGNVSQTGEFETLNLIYSNGNDGNQWTRLALQLPDVSTEYWLSRYNGFYGYTLKAPNMYASLTRTREGRAYVRCRRK